MRALIVASLLAAAAGSARAYPQFQLSTGAARCNQCHYAPAGGGLINNYGRDESADTISMGGNGGFLHGLWEPPPWLALGADARVAGLINNEGATEGAEVTAFPMQLDVYARAQVGAFSLYLTGGVRGVARSNHPTFLSLLVSREHYLMWRPKATGPYARIGRFFAPYGLRLAEHTSYIRRWLGFNTFEETYNVSGGYVGNDWELHATAFMPDFLRPVGQRGSGGALYFEKRFGDHAAAGAQARVASGSDELRAQVGLVGKYYLAPAKLLFLGEVDLVNESFDDAINQTTMQSLSLPSRRQLAAYLGASWMFKRGFMAQLMLERWDEDLSVKGVARDAVGAEFQWFPTAHLEVSLYGRVQLLGAGGDDGDASQVVLLQVHYYL